MKRTNIASYILAIFLFSLSSCLWLIFNNCTGTLYDGMDQRFYGCFYNESEGYYITISAGDSSDVPSNVFSGFLNHPDFEDNPLSFSGERPEASRTILTIVDREGTGVEYRGTIYEHAPLLLLLERITPHDVLPERLPFVEIECPEEE